VADGCAVPGCRGEVDLIYLRHSLCSHHWNELADDDSFSRLRMVLGIEPDRSTALEEAMDETATVETTTEPKEDTPVSRKKTAKPKTKPAKAPKPTKAAKQPKPKKAPKEPVPGRVFAIRVTDAELEAIHKASGPRNATRFIRSVAAAFANEDEGAFKAVLKEAREVR
jgi:outer membrane biosynthesis protein TonB